MKYIFSLFFILLITNAGGQTSILQNVTEASQIIHRYKFGGVVGSGAAFFDYNNDYLEDIFLTGGTLPSSLFRNNGDGTFTNVTIEAGLYLPNNFITNGVVTGDLDNDGFRDIFITTLKQGGPNYSHNLLFKNNGDGTFSFITFLAGIHETAQEGTEIQSGFSATMGDVNLDGYLDIYIANWVENAVQIRDSITNEVIGFDYTGATNRLYLNNGDMTFTDVADVYGVTDNGCSLVGVFSDYDQDRDMDILVANDFGSWVRPDALYRNDFPSLPFVDVSTESQFATPLYGMAIAVGDYDQDSDLDYYKTSIGPAVLMQNQQDGTFLEVAENAGVADAYVEGDSSYLSTHFGAGFTDFDNDGWLDLAVAKGRVGFDDLFPSTDEMPNQLWHNLGDGSFESANHWFDEPCYQMSRGLAYADFDNDGKMDVLFANSDSTYQGNTSGHPFLYQNNFDNDNRWLKVKVEGTVNNRDGFGTHLTIFVNGQSWLHEISGGGQGHSSQNSSVAHFGLGTTEIVDSLIVSWPGNLTAPQTFHQIPINHYLKITEGQTEWEVIQGETPTVSTQEMLIETLNLRIFPNPTHDMVKLPDLDAGTMITLFNSQGQIVKQQLLSTEKSLSLTHLPKGIYWLQAEQLGQFITGKISKL